MRWRAIVALALCICGPSTLLAVYWHAASRTCLRLLAAPRCEKRLPLSVAAYHLTYHEKKERGKEENSMARLFWRSGIFLAHGSIMKNKRHTVPLGTGGGMILARRAEDLRRSETAISGASPDALLAWRHLPAPGCEGEPWALHGVCGAAKASPSNLASLAAVAARI